MRWFDHRLSNKEEKWFCLNWSCVCLALLLLLNVAMWSFFSHRCHVPYFNLAHQMNWFLFLLLLCKFPFEWSQTFGSDGSVASRWEFEMSIPEAIWAPVMSFQRWHSFGLFLSEAKEPISWDFLCRAQLSLWTDNVLAKVRFFLRCLIDAVWTPH